MKLGSFLETLAWGATGAIALSLLHVPAGVPVATFAIGEAGATNAALYAAAILALSDEALAKKLTALRDAQTQRVLGLSLPDPS